MKKVEENVKKVLTYAASACIIIQVANGNGKHTKEFPSINMSALIGSKKLKKEIQKSA